MVYGILIIGMLEFSFIFEIGHCFVGLTILELTLLSRQSCQVPCSDPPACTVHVLGLQAGTTTPQQNNLTAMYAFTNKYVCFSFLSLFSSFPDIQYLILKIIQPEARVNSFPDIIQGLDVKKSFSITKSKKHSNLLKEHSVLSTEKPLEGCDLSLHK